MCCGVGISTVPWGVGVDTSETMLGVAKCRSRKEKDTKKTFKIGNAETYGDDKSVDAVTCFLATHEMPQDARIKVLNNALRIATKKVIFVDIHPGYQPSRQMLSGEPYMMDFVTHIEDDFKGATTRTELIKDKVVMWEFDQRSGSWF